MNVLVSEPGKDQRTMLSAQPGAEDAPDAPAIRIPRIKVDAFWETREIAGEIERAAADRRMARAEVTETAGGIRAARKRYRQERTPDLILLETRAEGEDLLEDVDSLAEVCDVSTKLILIGHSNDIDLYRALMRRGVSEYLRAPLESMSIISAIAAVFEEPDAVRLGRVYAFVAARGGAGSSTIAHNVAQTLGRFAEERVILVDMDLPFGTAALDFDLKPERGIADAVRDPERLDDQMLDRLLTPCSEQLSLLAAPGMLDVDGAADPEALQAVLDLAQANASHVVLDIPHLWSEWARRTLYAADEVVITATPDLPSLRNAKNMVDLLRQTRPNDRPPRLVLNQVGIPRRPEIKPKKFAEALEITPLATLPFDPRCFGTASNTGRMLPDAPKGRQYGPLLRQMAETLAGRPLRKRRFGALGRLFGRKKSRK